MCTIYMHQPRHAPTCAHTYLRALLAADEARHTAHPPAGLTPLAGGTASTGEGEGEGGGGGGRGEGEGEGDDAGSVADSTAGFLASHTFDPNSDPEVQWQSGVMGARGSVLKVL